MKHIFSLLLTIILVIGINTARAEEQTTQRIPQFSNTNVTVWKTIIYPTSKQILTMHRHDHARVLVALTNGRLKITNNKGKTHYLTLKKDTAYYLTQDRPNELHKDENISGHPIKVMVIELNLKDAPKTS